MAVWELMLLKVDAKVNPSIQVCQLVQLSLMLDPDYGDESSGVDNMQISGETKIYADILSEANAKNYIKAILRSHWEYF